MWLFFIVFIALGISEAIEAAGKATYCEEPRLAIDYLMVGPTTAGLRKEKYYLKSLKSDLHRAEQLATIYLARCKE